MLLRTCLFWYIIIIIINYWACFNSTSLAIYLLATMQEPTHENKVTAVNTNNNIQANVYEPFKSYIDATGNATTSIIHAIVTLIAIPRFSTNQFVTIIDTGIKNLLLNDMIGGTIVVVISTHPKTTHQP